MNNDYVSFNAEDVDDFLAHYGILGMKWGVRRYQNKDGSLTAAGKKRQAKLESELEKLGGKKKSSSDKSSNDFKDMTDDEIRAKTTRLNLEKDYQLAMKNWNDAMAQPVKDVSSKKVSRGKKFVETLKDDLVEKMAKNVAADLIAQTTKALGAEGINKVLNATLNPNGTDKKSYVYTNNQKK